MDWSRAKSILILAFLFLDLFLGYQVYISKTKQWMEADTGQSGQVDLEQYLSRQNIKLEAEVPQDAPTLSYLYVEYQGFNTIDLGEMPGQRVTLENSLLRSRFTQPVVIGNAKTPKEILRYMSNRVMFADQYQEDPYWSLDGTLVYWQMHDQLPLFVALLEFGVEGQTIKGYQQTYLHVRNQGSGRQIIFAHTALRSLVDKQIIKSGETIENVQLGYYGYKYDADIQVLAPVWRFIHNGEIHYVNGFTGAVESPVDNRIMISK
ncbi:two-component system regulatory protein YycI [Brevibacillus dissolubilis]|uniref:two-component system regulatory protein YycI n=1 Tax=Brevibacillus dissolubilis TaxID=1844116 RepID=UPI001117242A|nr:two-component system regulatory protein YycI [Brevibacillus dissolubilis]